MTTARFDDLSPGHERAFALADPIAVIEARRPDEVAGVLSAAEAAAERGSWVAGYVAYDAAPGLDADQTVAARAADDPFVDLPLAWFTVFADRRDVAPLEPSDPTSGARAVAAAWQPSVDRDAYDAAIARIRGLIAAGETYQVNHTMRMRARLEGDARGLYRDLALAQRGGYAAYLSVGRYRVVSASPERFFRLDGDRVSARPMKGTAARGRWLAEDEAIAARLVASDKDRAENAMIVDLIRNDLGRVAVPGSVRTTSMFDPERYETVWQLTSTIEANLPPRTPLVDVFRALFPSGSVTGAPKVATMRIIRELEREPRGVYCGAVGFLAPPGASEPRASFNVAIRTVVVDTASGVAEYGVGGGITYDSSPAAEYAEVLAKAQLLTAARPRFELFETLFHDAHGFRHLDEHLERLTASARYFGFRLDPEDAEAALEAAVGSNDHGPTRVRLVLRRDGSIRAEPSAPPPVNDAPVTVAVDREPVDPADIWLFHKTTLREPYERRRERRPDVDDILLTNTRDEVTESTIANLAVRLGARWWTPPLDAGLLAGTYRSALVRDGILEERRVRTEELAAAEELALVSSVRGWRPAVLVA